MTMSRRSFSKLVGAGLFASSAGLALPAFAQGKAKRLKVANFYPSDHAMNRAIREVFMTTVPEYTNGAYTISLHDNSSLGSEVQLSEGMRIGTIEIAIIGGLLGTSSNLPTSLLELPYVFKDYDHVWRVLDGEIGDDLAKEFEKINVKILGWLANGFRSVTNSVRPIQTLADTEGIRLRVPESKVYIETSKALGFSVVTMPFGEVFNALSQKVVDGQENPPSTVLTGKWYEVQPYLAVTNHLYSYGAFAMNMRTWNKLSPAEQEGMLRAAKETSLLQRRLLEEDAKADIEKLAALGMEVTYPNLDELREATAGVRASIAAEYPGGPELLARIMAA